MLRWCLFHLGRCIACISLVSIALQTFSLIEAGESWTSFQNGGDLTVESSSLAAELAPLWEIALIGEGQSSPVVWSGQVYVTSISGANKEECHVAAYQLDSGERLWSHTLKNATPQESSNYVSKAAPSPTVDKSGLYCFFEGGNLLKLSHSGEVLWERNLVTDYGKIDARHGIAASLEQNHDSVFVWVERQTEPYLLSIAKDTGETRWKVAGLGTTSWASPRLVPVESQQHLVLSGIGKLVGIKPVSGDRLWEFNEITGNSTPTPIPLGDGQFLMGATVGREETNTGRAAESNGVIEIRSGNAGHWKVDYLWQAKRATSSFGSPVATDAHCYFVNRSGVAYCLDRNTGAEVYAERLGGSIWATPFVAGGNLFFPLKEGSLKVVKRGAEYAESAEHQIFTKNVSDKTPFGGQTLYAAVVVNSQILFRTGDHLYSFGPPTKN